MTNERLEQIKQRMNAATPGPWRTNEDGHVFGPQKQATTVAANTHNMIYRMYELKDGEFVVHARDDIPWLVAEVERLEAEFNKLQNEIIEMNSERDIYAP